MLSTPLARVLLVLTAAVCIGAACKLGYEYFRYHKWDGLEDEVDEWRDLDTRYPSDEGLTETNG